MNLLFWKKEDGGLAPSIKYIGIPSMAAAFAILGVPGFSDAALHFLDKYLGLHLDFEQSHTAGWIFLSLGVGAFVIQGILSFCRNSPFIALQHVSFAPISRRLETLDLPPKLRARNIEELSCDLFTFMQPATPDLEVAVRVQLDWARRAQALQTVLKTAPVGYYGIVHVPFQFLAGFFMSSFVHVNLFELDRNSAKWKTLSETTAPDLHSSCIFTGDENAPDVSIRVSVSYLVETHQLDGVLRPSRFDAHLSIAHPRLDALTSYCQIRNLCENFRRLLDDPRLRGKTKHIFYAGPVSLGFALGQRISSTIHGTINVYNFNARSPVLYPWSLSLALQEQEIHVRRF